MTAHMNWTMHDDWIEHTRTTRIDDTFVASVGKLEAPEMQNYFTSAVKEVAGGKRGIGGAEGDKRNIIEINGVLVERGW